MELLFENFLEVLLCKSSKWFKKRKSTKISTSTIHCVTSGLQSCDSLTWPWSDNKGFKNGWEMVWMGNSAVIYRTSKENIVFGLGRKTLKSNSSPIWPRCLQSAKPFVKRILVLTLTVWWSFSPPTSCQNPQVIDPRNHQPPKKHFFFFWTNLRKLILCALAVTFTIN